MGKKMSGGERCGWDVASFAEQSGVARATLYNVWSERRDLGPRFAGVK